MTQKQNEKQKLSTIFFVIAFFLNLHGQDIRINTSIVITVNDNVTPGIENLRVILIDTTGKEDIIAAGYYPGAIFFSTIEAKHVFETDTLKRVNLAFDVRSHGRKSAINNYRIVLTRSWFKQSCIVLKIADINKKGKYKYSFEVPGIYFAKPGYVIGGIKN